MAGSPGRPGGRGHRRPPRCPIGGTGRTRLGPSGGYRGERGEPDKRSGVYAVGDAVEKPDAISHATSLIALANVANRQGRGVADHIAGRPSHSVASLGTAIVKVFDVVAATVGWNERQLRAAGRPYRAIHSHPFDHATYYPGVTRMAVKLIFEPNDGVILGAQIVGQNGVDKRIDVIATAMANGMRAHHLADLELAYAPPFSSAKDPVNLLGYMAENILSGDCEVVAPDELAGLIEKEWSVVDVRTAEEHARVQSRDRRMCRSIRCEITSTNWATDPSSSIAK